MQKIGYRQSRLVTNMALTAFGAMLCGLLWWATSSILAGLLTLGLGGLSGLFAVTLVNGRPAIAYDERQVSLTTLLSNATFAWSEVHDIRITSSTARIYFVIPLPTIRHLVFTVASKQVRISVGLLELPRGGIAEICAQLSAARLAGADHTVGLDQIRTGAAPASDARDDDAPLVDFDPDAAIKRYLARRDAEGKTRPGAEPAPPVAPPRPVFGRRGVQQ